MPDQPSLPGLSMSSEPTDRLFFGIFPDAATSARITQLREPLCAKHGLRGSRIAPDRLHVTLHHLGDFCGLPEHVVQHACQAAASSAERAAPFRVRFSRVQSFSGKPGNLPCVLRDQGDNPELMDLHRRLLMALAKTAKLKFVPHVTLLYDAVSVADEAVEPVEWQVDEIVLVHSLLGRTRHLPLGRWKLEG